ncbi:MAG TPA: hydantoinase/oxoprolinase family protein, partial [Acetobacteraceae bacterium]|nr:hydantoinase/oxoprolinase family protein [Acetobacteraceae bacterium]
VVSAMGGLIADVKNDFIRTLFLMAKPGDAERLRQEAASLEAQGRVWLRDEQRFTGEATPSWFADMRYRGQSFEIEVSLRHAWILAGDMEAIAEAFHQAHHSVYDFCDRESTVQIINLRLVMSGNTAKPRFRRLRAATGEPSPERVLRVFFDRGWHDVPLYRRAGLLPGHTFRSPAVVAQDDTTVCIPPGFTARVDETGNILLGLEG